MKNHRFTLLLLLSLLLTNIVKAYDFKVDGLCYDRIDDSSVNVVAFLGKQFKGHNYSEIPVVNCDEVRLKDITSAVQDIRVDVKPQDIYDIYGRKVRSNTTSLQGLPHGIYIVGGKKVVK